MMIQKILFPVDFSPSCEAMAPFVKRAAQMCSAQVTLLHVFDLTSSGFELMERSLREMKQDREHAARGRLNSFLVEHFPLDGCTRLLRIGDAPTRIAEMARERHFDLIVMPTHAGTFRRMLLGSTTAKILNDADCPVMTTQHAETIAPRPLEHREWACAVSLQEDSERVLRFANQMAEDVHANLSIIHAISPGEPGFKAQFDLDERVNSKERELARERIEELQRRVASHVPVKVVVGPIKDALTGAARHLGADVLMIGRGAEAGVRLRDLTYAVVRDAPCPVVSI
jgi:nucleotide-binding universal stress UspA family protein